MVTAVTVTIPRASEKRMGSIDFYRGIVLLKD
jgi:uncharacterized membrane protein